MEKLTVRFAREEGNEAKEQLVSLLEEKVQSFAEGLEIGIDRTPVHHSKIIGTPTTLPRVEANRISATGDYGILLELVNQ